MRLAHRYDRGGLRLIAACEGGWTEVAAATGDERLATLSGLLRAGESAWPKVSAAVRSVRPAFGRPERLGPVLDAPDRIFCIGRNYAEHRNEFHNAPSPWPEVFLRFGSSLIGPEDDVPRTSLTGGLDYEGELGVIIGRPGRHIPADQARRHIFGYTVVNDVTVRDWQHRGRQWTSGKNFDGTLPAGPHIVTADALDPSDLGLTTRVNGNVMQSARTSEFIFDLGEQIEFLSSFTELRPGDLICTGTPGGVGWVRKPPVLLVPGDMVDVTIEGIGTICNRIVDDRLVPATDRWRSVAVNHEGAT